MGLLRVFSIAGILLVTSLFTGRIQIGLPHPAKDHRVQPWPLYTEHSPLDGRFKPNTALQSTKKYLKGKIRGPESIAISPSGDKIYLGDKFGGIYVAKLDVSEDRVEIELESSQPIFRVQGRPLGLHALSDRELLICDTTEGLIKVDVSSRTYTVLVNRARAKKRTRSSKVVYANDVDVGPDGVIYFSDSTDIPVVKCKEGYYSTFRTYILNLMEGRPSGRLIAYDPSTNVTKEILSELWYANGVAVSEDGSFVAVVETNGLRVHKYYLNKSVEVAKNVVQLMISELPGMPDGISKAPDGNFWIALVAPPVYLRKLMYLPIVRAAYAWISEYVNIPLSPWGYVLKVDQSGQVLAVLSDIDGGFVSAVSSAVEHKGKLFLGNLVGDYISVFDLKLLSKGVSEEVDHDDKEL